MTRGHQVVLKPRAHYGRKIAYALLALCLLVGGGWGIFDYGRYRAGFDAEAALQRTSMLELRIQSLSEEGQRLREKTAILEHGKEIDKAAYISVEGDLKALQDEVRELKQQLTFYQNIVSPADIKTGVRVQTIGFDQQAELQQYQYQVILIQGPKRARRASGRLRISIIGQKSDKEVTLSMKDLHLGKAGSGKYRFRYFQEFQGEIKLPEAFEPQEVLVKLVPDGKNPKVVEERYAWESVVN